MKILPFLTLLIAISATVQAQALKYQVGIESGYSITSLSGDQFGKKYQAENKIHYSSKMSAPVGVAFQYDSPRIFSVRTGISFEDKGNVVQLPSLAYEISSLKYMTIPVLLRASYGKDLNIFVNAGPYFSYLLENSIEYNYSQYDTSFTVSFIESTIDNSDKMKKTDAGISTGIGIGYVIGKEFFLSIEWRGSFGLSDINNYAADSPGYYKEGRIHTTAASFLIGVAYKFGERMAPQMPER